MKQELIKLVSVSGGKDSAATLLLALENNWQNEVRAVFADTGNEHQATIDHVAHLSEHLTRETGHGIVTVMADFAKQMAAKREKLKQIANGVPESEIYGKRQFSAQWTPERAARAAELMQPTGNVFLDLCLLKGGFPSRKRQYCTAYLKRDPVEAHQFALTNEANRIESWQGVRADESASRVNLPDYEWGPIFSTRRPILRWGIDRVFAQHRKHGIKPNPLYSAGSKRVGCMPCINSGKSDISSIALRHPEHIDKVREYERIVSACSRNPIPATFFHTSSIGGRRGIDVAVAWAKTTRGGKQYDLLAQAEDATACSSLYGLCE